MIHRFSYWSALAGLVLALGLASAPGCSSDDSDDAPCTVQPAFLLTVHAVSGPLPTDTTLSVEYQGGVEEYRLGAPNPGLEDVLCSAMPDGGSDVQLLTCKLWTQGAATVTVKGGGFPEIKRELDADGNGKCFKTVSVDVVLGDQDAAP